MPWPSLTRGAGSCCFEDSRPEAAPILRTAWVAAGVVGAGQNRTGLAGAVSDLVVRGVRVEGAGRAWSRTEPNSVMLKAPLGEARPAHVVDPDVGDHGAEALRVLSRGAPSIRRWSHPRSQGGRAC